MRVTVHLTDVLSPYDRNRTDDGHTTKLIDVEPDTSIADVGQILRLGTFSIEYDRYYRVTDPNFLESYLPYIVSGGHVRWMPHVQDVSIADFFETQQIQTHELYIRHGWPAASGFGFVDIQSLWQQIYPILVYLAPIIAASRGAAAALTHGVKVVGRIRARIARNELNRVSPGWLASFVAARTRWNSGDLALLTGLTREQVKDFLRFYGFEYDQHLQMYCKTPATDEMLTVLKGQKWMLVPGRMPDQ